MFGIHETKEVQVQAACKPETPVMLHLSTQPDDLQTLDVPHKCHCDGYSRTIAFSLLTC